MNIDVTLGDDEIDRIATRAAAILAASTTDDRWLDVGKAADHLSLSSNAVRALVKRRQIPFHRTANGRLRFSVTELDHWVRTRSCERTHEDYHDAP